MIFDLATTPNIIFGNGQLAMLPKLISQYGNRALLITGKSSFENSKPGCRLYADLKKAKIEFKTVNIENEPSPRDIDQAVLTHRQWSPQVTIGIGGGSVIDAGKAISAMLKHELPIKNYLEDVGTQKPNGNKVPFVAVPTTSGTGSEATKNAVITQAGKDGFKKSLRHNNYVPNIALIDPLLTVNCPPKVTAASGMDAFTQLLESYLSTNSNPFTNALALDGIT
nr:iron-containing alcohol dehydrogenase [Prolixibacteraceae bacterium]